jgi:hypothetical protein
MTVKTRLARLEAVRTGPALMIPREQAHRIKACFYDQYFPYFWRRAWRDAFAVRLQSGRLQAEDRRLIAAIPVKFGGEGQIRHLLLEAIEGAETLPGLWRD